MLGGDSTVLKQDSPYYEHFYSKVKPYEHYVPFKKDLSDLKEKVEWLKANDNEAKRIATNGRIFANNNLLPSNIFCYYALLLRVTSNSTNCVGWSETTNNIIITGMVSTSV